MQKNFNGFRVVAFESRRAMEIEKLISSQNGLPLVAPSMREVPLSEATEVLSFAEGLMAGAFDMVVLLTGVGTRHITEVIESRYPRADFVEALGKATLVARGPKPVAALRELGLKPDIVVPEPNTWKDLLAALDDVSLLPLTPTLSPAGERAPTRRVGGARGHESSLAGQRIAVQEYGVSNFELLSGLRERGAEVMPVPVYRWALPEDLTPLREALSALAAGEVEIVLFTSAQQVRHVMQVAAREGYDQSLPEAFQRVVIGSIGPTCSEAIREAGLTADYEPDSPHMGNLVRETARSSAALLHKKRTALDNGVDTLRWRRIDMAWSGDTPDSQSPVDGKRESRPLSTFLQACHRQPTDYTPVWLMRQAGRFMREYREIRTKVSFLELCKTPELAAEVTLMAVDRLEVDAAIIFADILLILESIGVDLSFDKGEGPRIRKPVRDGASVNLLREFEEESLSFVYEALRLTRRALAPEIALIGFAGAPFTVASYAVEGHGSRNYENTKKLMYHDAGAWHELMRRLSHATADYLNRQIAVGADAVQLFDSWVGCLSPEDYREFVLPHTKRLIGRITPGVPVIHFGTDTTSLLPMMKEAGGHVLGLDWRVDLRDTWEMLGYEVAIQGNLDPVVLFAPPAEIRRRAQRILDQADARPGHIFNLGHGVLPGTPYDHVLALVDAVHELSARSR